MKYLTYLLLCGLISSPALAQSTPKNKPVVMCRATACAAPVNRAAQREVTLGSFASFHATALHANPPQVLWHPSAADRADSAQKQAHNEMLIGKAGSNNLSQLKGW